MDGQVKAPRPVGRPAATIGLLHPVSWFLGIYLLAVAVALTYAVFLLWPHVAGDAGTAEGASAEVTIFTVPLVGSVQIIALAMALGGLGSYLHVARSFVVFVGNGQLAARWFWWYLLWPFIGMILAAITCFVVQAGFMPGGGNGTVNPYGIAAISALVGMFAKPATEKLREVFETLFTVRNPTPLQDSLGGGGLNPRPSDISVNPSEIEPWRGARTVSVVGHGFVEGSEVLVQGSTRATEFVSPTELRALLLPEDSVAEGNLELAVRNPPSGGGMSERATLQVKRKDSVGVPSSPQP